MGFDRLFTRKNGGIAVIVLLGLLFIKSAYFVINEGERGILLRVGQLQDEIYTPGIHFKLPLLDTIKTLNIQTQKIEINADAASRDQQTVLITLALNYRLNPNAVGTIYQTIGLNEAVEFRIIGPAMQDSVKGGTAQFTAEQLITRRREVSDTISKSLRDRLERQGIEVVDVNIVNYSFSEEFNKAIEAKVKAEQEALAEKNRLERTKYEAQQAIERAKAQAESIRIQAEAIRAQGGAEYVQLQWINKRDGKLPQTMLDDGNGVILNLSPNQ
ncbi:MAG: prohibitin family protein [Candidatus Absconditabacterales bacterium]|nr:prohibitin family protein [Candidatus Absconditabacterales bacterium]